MVFTHATEVLKIGEVAAASSLPVKTIRYYEELGLLSPTVQRSESHYRLFSPQVLNRLAFIRRAQALGLSLGEIHQILDIHDQGQLPCGDIKHHLQTKVDAINQQIEALLTLRAELEGILSGWRDPVSLQGNPQTICPNLQIEE